MIVVVDELITCGDLPFGTSLMLSYTEKQCFESTAYIVLRFYAVVVKPARYLSMPTIIIIIIIVLTVMVQFFLYMVSTFHNW